MTKKDKDCKIASDTLAKAGYLGYDNIMIKTLKLSIVVSIIVVGFSVVYYFLILLPEYKNSEQAFLRKQECAKFIDSLKKSFSLKGSYVNEVFYSPNLNTCVGDIRIGGNDVLGNEYIDHSVVDLLSNQSLGYYSTGGMIIDATGLIGTKEEIYARWNKANLEYKDKIKELKSI